MEPKLNWTEVRTAHSVAKHGSVSVAAAALGIHRATVVRHIDALEAQLGVKLFLRHNLGYKPTDLGETLRSRMDQAEEEFAAFTTRCRLREDNLEGELHIACMEICKTLLMPALGDLHDNFPKLVTRITMTQDVLRLEYGEAHAALRLGVKVDDPRYIHEHLADISLGLFAHRRYVDRFGLPKTLEDATDHRFICVAPKTVSTSIHTWLQERVPEESIKYLSDSPLILDNALEDGLGIGFRPLHLHTPQGEYLPVCPELELPNPPLWFVVHVDMLESRRVQTLLTILKQRINQL